MGARSTQALRMLTALVRDREHIVAQRAVDVLFLDYSSQTLRQAGGRALRDNLLWHARRSPNPRILILLSSFTRDQEIITFLNGLRERYRTRKDKIESYRPMGEFIVVIDVALAEIGAAGGVPSVSRHISRGDIPNLLLILDALPFINDRTILLQVAELLRDRRVARSSEYGDRHNRVCDEMMAALDKRNGGLGLFLLKQFSDGELSQAYQRFRAQIGA
jgi:hypothetical protein